MTVAVIAAATALETVRRRVVAIAAVASLVLVFAIGWGFHRIAVAVTEPTVATGIQAVLTILLAFAFSVVLAVGTAFLAAPAIAAEIESGIALAILPRPVSRTAYVLGKWLGLALLVAGYAGGFGALAFAAIAIAGGYHAPHVLLALAFLIAQSVALFTLALALSTRLTPIATGIVAVAAFGAAWIAGITNAIARALNATLLAHAAAAVGILIPTDGLWRGALYELTPVMMLVAQGNADQPGRVNPFGVTAPPSPVFLIWSMLWIALVLAAAVASMRRRDI